MTITYFGYGSLVNTRTLGPQAVAEAGTLSGWRREWRAWWRPEGAENLPKVCTLTVRRAADTAIRGVMVSEPAEWLAELDARERRYRRIDGIGPSFRRDKDGTAGAASAFLYEADSEIRRPGTDEHPILQSYVDCVLAGFYAFWGEEGLRHFIETTDGWDAPMLADRSAPRYPRAQVLDADLLALFDDQLAGTGLRYIQA